MGIILAILFLSGKIPSSKDKLQISLKFIEISLLTNFKNFIGIEEGPEDLVSSRELIISHISYVG